MLENCSFRR